MEKTNLLVEDPLVPACGFALDSLAPGASVSQSCESGPLFADLTNRASATADSPAGPVAASATALVTVLQPSVGIAKTPEAQLVNLGEAASFTITLSNPGDTTLTELVVSDPLTPSCERGLGELDALAPGASVSYACASGPLDAGFTNLVSVSGFAGALPVAASASALVTLRQPILIEKSPAEQSVPIGASAQFTINVSNPGEDLKTGVRVEDPLSPDCARATGEIPDLQPNGGAFTYVCSSGPLDLDLLNQATVIAQGAEGQVSASDSALALVLEPLVTFSKIALEPQIEAGTSARFGIEIANPGSEILSQISVSDPLAPDCGRGESGETPGLPLADLAPGESLSYECQSDLLYADLVNVATVSALAGTELVSAEASAAVDVVTPIEIIKAPDEQQVLAGESARFEITLSNPSAVTRTELAVSDPLTPDCDRAIGTLPDLAPGATLSYECRTGPLFAGFTNQATVSAQGPGGSSSASDYAEVLVLAPEIGIVKAPPVQLVDPGASASFTITVSNPGSGDLLSVQVTDAATPDCSRDLGALPPGVSVSYDCATAALDTDFTNLAQVEAESLAGVAVSAAASAFVNVLNTIEIFKLPQEQTLPPGSQASFEITLVNESDGLLTNLAVSDPLSPDCERSVGSLPDLLPNGGSYSYLCLSPVLSADLLNVATVSADSADGPVSATASALVRVLAPQTCFTDQTATSSGEATLCFIGGGPDCGFEEVAYIALTGDPLSPPAGSAPEGLLFPQGLVVQRIGDGCAPGFTAEFSWELPTVMPADTLLWKYGPTSDDPSPHWYSLPTVVNGNVISFSITDGARGDSDLAENGTIVDPGGPASSQRAAPSPIPSLHWLALALLSLMLGLLGVRARRH